ncbi:hypothetical protein KA089_01260 [Candidatus Woesebacteria bacterium]|nr:hypothetical protein [Candidatus Woesebacteria bacterium]
MVLNEATNTSNQWNRYSSKQESLSSDNDKADFIGSILEFVADSKVFLARLQHSNKEVLKKIGIKTKEQMDAWSSFVYSAIELFHGLATKGKGEWGMTWGLTAKDPKNIDKLQNKVINSIVYETLRDVQPGKEKPAIKYDYKTNKDGSLKSVEPLPDSRQDPVTFRVLRGGPPPLDFIDINISMSTIIASNLNTDNKDINPLDIIPWKGIMEGNEKILEILKTIPGIKIGPPRYLKDWYEEPEDDENHKPDRTGEFYKPDVLIGKGNKSWRLTKFGNDARIMMLAEYGDKFGRSAAINVSFAQHASGDGLELMGSETAKKDNVQSAFDKTLKKPEIIELLDENGKADSIAALELIGEFEPQVLPFHTLLSTKYGRFGLGDLRQQIEKRMAATQFQSKVMAKFGARVDASRIQVGIKLDPELTNSSRKTVKLIKAKGVDKMNGSLLSAMALHLHAGESCGVMIQPNEGRTTLVTVGNKIWDKWESVCDKFSNDDQIDRLRTYPSMKNGIKIIRDRLKNQQRLPDIKDLDDSDTSNWLIEKIPNIENIYTFDNELRNQIEPIRNSVTNSLNEITDVDSFLKKVRNKNGEAATNNNAEWDLATMSKKMELVIAKAKQNPKTPFSKLIIKIDEAFNNVDSLYYITEQFNNKIKSLNIAEKFYPLRSFSLNVNHNPTRSKINAIFLACDQQKLDGFEWILSDTENNEEQFIKSFEKEFEGTASSMGKVGDFFIEAGKDPNLTPPAISRDLGFLAVVEGWAVNHTPNTAAAARSQIFRSGLYEPEDTVGTAVVFHTANSAGVPGLGAMGNSMGLADTRETSGLKETLDHPSKMMDVLLPWLRGNENVKRSFKNFLIQKLDAGNEKTKKEKDNRKKLSLFQKMLSEDDFACFNDNNSEKTVKRNDLRIWGPKRDDEKRLTARDLSVRYKHHLEGELLFDVWNQFMEAVEQGQFKIDDKTKESLKKFNETGFKEMWGAMIKFRALDMQHQTAKANLIMRLWINPQDHDESSWEIYVKQYSLARDSYRNMEKVFSSFGKEY